MFFRMVYKSGQIFLPFCHNTRVWQTDRRTDRQTDRQKSPRHTAADYMQRGNYRHRFQPGICSVIIHSRFLDNARDNSDVRYNCWN